MKKILLGMLMTTCSPFVSILGWYIIHFFKIGSSDAIMFASVMGCFSIVFNFIIGCLLIIRGYQDLGTFKGWSA